jgi:hypothetical protein
LQSERHSSRRDQHAREVEETGPDGKIRRHGIRVDYRRDRVRGVVEAVDELETQGDKKRNPKQYVWIRSSVADHRQVICQVNAGIYDPGDDHDACQDIEPGIGLLPNQRRRRGCVLDSARRLIDRIDIGHAVTPESKGRAWPWIYRSVL